MVSVSANRVVQPATFCEADLRHDLEGRAASPRSGILIEMSEDNGNRRYESGTQPITTTLGGRIRFERQVKGWTQTQLAEASGLTREEIARIEGGEETASLETAKRIAAALEITMGQLAHAAPDATRMTKPGVG